MNLPPSLRGQGPDVLCQIFASKNRSNCSRAGLVMYNDFDFSENCYFWQSIIDYLGFPPFTVYLVEFEDTAGVLAINHVHWRASKPLLKFVQRQRNVLREGLQRQYCKIITILDVRVKVAYKTVSTIINSTLRYKILLTGFRLAFESTKIHAVGYR